MQLKYENCGDLDQIIEEWEKEIPDKRTKEYVVWKEKMNYLYREYNKLVKFKCYKPIK